MKAVVKIVLVLLLGAAIGVICDRAVLRYGFDMPRSRLIGPVTRRSTNLTWRPGIQWKSVEFLIAVPKNDAQNIESLEGDVLISAKNGTTLTTSIRPKEAVRGGWLDRYERVAFMLPGEMVISSDGVREDVHIEVRLRSDPIGKVELWAHWMDTAYLLGR